MMREDGRPLMRDLEGGLRPNQDQEVAYDLSTDLEEGKALLRLTSVNKLIGSDGSNGGGADSGCSTGGHPICHGHLSTMSTRDD